MQIAVIGGGASGLAAALQAAWRGASVTLLERNLTLGRKLLVTGSGRCNVTNDGAAAEKYTCADPEWMAVLLASFGVQALRGMLAQIGIPLYKTSDGWYYPLSNSAQTVVDSFACAVDLAGVTRKMAHKVTRFAREGAGFRVWSVSDHGEESETFDRVILAAGGKAYPDLGSRGELFPALEALGHTVIPKRPALAPVLADLGSLAALQGVKLDAGVGLWEGDRRLAAAAGNLIFTEWGLNGPAVMDISHHVSARPGRPLELSLDLLYFYEDDFKALLAEKRRTPVPVRVFLGAFLPPKAASLYPQLEGISDAALDRLDETALERLSARLRNTRLRVKGVRDFAYCQLSAGGVPVTEADPHTLESKVAAGLFLTGETLDVVGPCGGYNLQFAFAGGALAGLAAAGKAD